MLYLFSMIRRALKLLQVLGERSSVLLFGARGVGKTRLCQTILATRHPQLIFDLLDGATYTRLLIEPTQFAAEIERALTQSPRLLVFVDEVQRLPDLLNEVHRLLEGYKPRLQFLLTGSSARKLRRGGANLLAGRALTLHLHPLSSLEFEPDLSTVLLRGSLPGILFDQEHPDRALKSYVATYLREEIQQEALVRRVESFARFLDVAGQYHGEILNAASIAKTVRMSPATIAEYLQILEDTLVAWRLPGWSASPRKQMRTAPKLYLFDNGVASALRGELLIELKESTARYGKLFECWIVQEVHRWNDYLELDLRFSYWRTSGDQEVDLVVSRGLGPPLAAIEIKSKVQPDVGDCRGLMAFANDYPDVPRYIMCRAVHEYELEGSVLAIPWQGGVKLLQELAGVQVP